MEHNNTFSKSFSLRAYNAEKPKTIPNVESVSITIDQNKQSVLRHHVSAKKQHIKITVAQGATCVLQSSDLVGEVDLTEIDLEVIVQEAAQFTLFFSSMYTTHITYNISVYVQGDHAQASLYGLYALDGQQKVYLHTYQYHHGEHTKSDLIIKGMLKDKARVAYHGLIKIDEQAQKADASQEHKNIVLSKDAKVVSIPSIEVLQHDVQCCHGSAIGKFDTEHLWYLQSKGIDHITAYELLIQSFFQEVLIGAEHKEKLEKRICQKML